MKNHKIIYGAVTASLDVFISQDIPIKYFSRLIYLYSMSNFQKLGTARLQDFSTRPFSVALLYLALLTVSESVAVMVAPVTGAVMHMATLFLLLLQAAFTWFQPIHRFLLALTLVPLIRIISLSLPLVNFPLIYRLLITSLPLFGAAFVVMRELNFSWGDVFGFRWRGLPAQLTVGMIGILLGAIEFTILHPEPLIQSFSWQSFWLPASILLISTGFLEEFIFRFLLQRTSIESLGFAVGVAYAGLLFALLHIGYHSILDFLFVLAAGLFFGLIVFKTRSMIGVAIAHGLTNVSLYLIMPFIS
ncbi:MAG: lysostaphin resistance A-like protein [Candidatus Promineifilaceae bacterium]